MLSFQLERNSNQMEIEFTLGKLRQLGFEITDYGSIIFASKYGDEISGILTRSVYPRDLALVIFSKINGHDQELMRISASLLGAVYVLK